MITGIFLFTFGLIIGSFLNAFIYRHITKQKLTGRSFCPGCKHKISWYDNIPIFSFIFLGGKCRHCKKRISFQYPIVELLTGALFVILPLKMNVVQSLNASLINLAPVGWLIIAKLATALLISTFLILIATYDLRTQEIPNEFNLIFAVVAIFFLALTASSNMEIIFHLASGLLAFLFLYFFVFISKETWMGGGDGKLIFSLGIILGPIGTLINLVLASWIGALFGILQIIKGKAKIKTAIPFGPFLVLGFILAFLFTAQITAFYVKMFLVY